MTRSRVGVVIEGERTCIVEHQSSELGSAPRLGLLLLRFDLLRERPVIGVYLGLSTIFARKGVDLKD